MSDVSCHLCKIQCTNKDNCNLLGFPFFTCLHSEPVEGIPGLNIAASINNPITYQS